MSEYKQNDRVELVSTTDEYTRLKPGLRGWVSFVDSLGTVHVNWDDGARLGMIPGEDVIKHVPVLAKVEVGR